MAMNASVSAIQDMEKTLADTVRNLIRSVKRLARISVLRQIGTITRRWLTIR